MNIVIYLIAACCFFDLCSALLPQTFEHLTNLILASILF